MLGDDSPNIHGTNPCTWHPSHVRPTESNVERQVNILTSGQPRKSYFQYSAILYMIVNYQTGMIPYESDSERCTERESVV